MQPSKAKSRAWSPTLELTSDHGPVYGFGYSSSWLQLCLNSLSAALLVCLFPSGPISWSLIAGFFFFCFVITFSYFIGLIVPNPLENNCPSTGGLWYYLRYYFLCRSTLGITGVRAVGFSTFSNVLKKKYLRCFLKKVVPCLGTQKVVPLLNTT